VRWDVEEITGRHLHHAILETKQCSAFQDDHPLVGAWESYRLKKPKERVSR
jgi:hypothetical protein